jgi:outer membrane protein OmpA-like peptidoglycan-associated protein
MGYKITFLGKALAVLVLFTFGYGMLQAMRPGNTPVTDAAKGGEGAAAPSLANTVNTPSPGTSAGELMPPPEPNESRLRTSGDEEATSVTVSVISPEASKPVPELAPVLSLANGKKTVDGACDQFALNCRLTVYYPPHSAAIDKSYLADLSNFAKHAKQLGKYRVRVEGHCALLPGQVVSEQQRKYYKVLSETRARQVASYLQSQGLTPEVLDVRGNSSAKPIGDNSNAQYRFHNRRTDVYLVVQ